jgi:hypothetical protein
MGLVLDRIISIIEGRKGFITNLKEAGKIIPRNTLEENVLNVEKETDKGNFFTAAWLV